MPIASNLYYLGRFTPYCEVGHDNSFGPPPKPYIHFSVNMAFFIIRIQLILPNIN